eukprot:GHVT01062450.1.p1 GENE.GHVT01062450.1~~GHVT01062450.1.p1  ORF type:complete len:380 (-),score=72.64 GHVT01062450.1:375-1514(-)
MYWVGGNLSDGQYLFTDLLVILPLATLMARTDAAEVLTPTLPPRNLTDAQVLIPTLAAAAFQLLLLFPAAAIAQEAGQDHRVTANNIHKNANQQIVHQDMMIHPSTFNSVLFALTTVQYPTACLAVSLNARWRKSILTNQWLTGLLFVLFCFGFGLPFLGGGPPGFCASGGWVRVSNSPIVPPPPFPLSGVVLQTVRDLWAALRRVPFSLLRPRCLPFPAAPRLHRESRRCRLWRRFPRFARSTPRGREEESAAICSRLRRDKPKVKAPKATRARPTWVEGPPAASGRRRLKREEVEEEADKKGQEAAAEVEVVKIQGEVLMRSSRKASRLSDSRRFFTWLRRGCQKKEQVRPVATSRLAKKLKEFVAFGLRRRACWRP